MRRAGVFVLKIVFQIAIACAVLLFLEGIFRLFKIGEPPPFFTVHQTKMGERLSFNPAYVERYFRYQPFGKSNMQARTATFQVFKREKDTDVFRIIALGESTAQGYPFNHRLSFPEITGTMLGIRHPGRRFEVINASVVALTSFAVLDLGAKTLESLHPDLLLIYAGHNEFHGIFGSASRSNRSHSGAMPRIILCLWNSNLYTFMENQAARLRNRFFGQADNAHPMELLASGQYVRPADDAHRVAVSNYRTNLYRLMEHAAAKGVPIVLIPPVSNLADMPPLASLTSTGQILDEAQKIRELETLDSQGLFADLRTQASNLMVRGESSAAIWVYYLGRAEMGIGENRLAEEHFKQALESDALHFRACDGIVNTAVTFADQARRPANSKVHVVDPRPILKQVSTHGIPGKGLFYEHVHPKFSGNLILAWSAALGIEAVTGMRTDKPDFPDKIYMEKIIQLPIDRFIADDRILKLLNEWPFRDRPQMNALRADVKKEFQETWREMDEISRAIVKDTQLLAQADDAAIYSTMGLAYLQAGQLPKANLCLSFAASERPEEPDILAALGASWLLLGNFTAAFHDLKTSIDLDPQNAFAHANLGLLFLKTGNFPDAEKAYREALRIDPQLIEARRGLAFLRRGI